MFNKNDFINWAKTSQNDNKTMQDFRSSHFNPMKQVHEVTMSGLMQGFKALSGAGAKKTASKVVKGVATDIATDVGRSGTQKAIEVARNKIKKRKAPLSDVQDDVQHEGVKGALGGAVAGGAAGAALGSIVPVVGTAIGGSIGAGIGGAVGDAAGNAAGKKKENKKQVPEHASYESRKEAGMRAMREFFGHQKKLGLGTDQIKQRAKQSQDAYGHSSSSGFKFGRPLAHQEPKEKPKV